MPAAPAYRRLSVEERRSQLLSKVLADVAAILEQPKRLITWA